MQRTSFLRVLALAALVGVVGTLCSDSSSAEAGADELRLLTQLAKKMQAGGLGELHPGRLAESVLEGVVPSNATLIGSVVDAGACPVSETRTFIDSPDPAGDFSTELTKRLVERGWTLSTQRQSSDSSMVELRAPLPHQTAVRFRTVTLPLELRYATGTRRNVSTAEIIATSFGGSACNFSTSTSSPTIPFPTASYPDIKSFVVYVAMPSVKFPAKTNILATSTEGGGNPSFSYSADALIESDASPADIEATVSKQVAASRWTRVGGTSSSLGAVSSWRKTVDEVEVGLAVEVTAVIGSNRRLVALTTSTRELNAVAKSVGESWPLPPTTAPVITTVRRAANKTTKKQAAKINR